jgi:hypothetical protein
LVKKKEAIALSLVGNRFFFFGEFFNEMAIIQAMQERCFGDFAELLAMFDTEKP